MTPKSSLEAERDRYRDLLYQRIIRDAASEMIAKFGGKSKGLNVLVEAQLAVRESNGKFHFAVIDQTARMERHGVSIVDLLTDMRTSTEFGGAFETKTSGPTKLANNP